MQNSRIRSSNLLPRNSIYLETRLSQLSEQKVHRKVAISAATAGPDMLCVDVSRLASALVGSTQNGYSMYSIYICLYLLDPLKTKGLKTNIGFPTESSKIMG